MTSGIVVRALIYIVDPRRHRNMRTLAGMVDDYARGATTSGVVCRHCVSRSQLSQTNRFGSSQRWTLIPSALTPLTCA